ncbi:unnamed protein product, partial [Laminaria digitata]
GGGEECWVAPEVAEGEEHSQRSDLYSYGGVLYEVWTIDWLNRDT